MKPALPCTIYDHQGFIGPPLQDIRGSKFKGDSDLLPRVRRWIGSTLFLGGIILIIVDWSTEFRLNWPSIVGNRILIFGVILLFTEALIVLHARYEHRHITKKKP